MRRVFLMVLDSCGAGALPDAAAFGDEGAHTLLSCHKTGMLTLPNLCALGLGHVEGLDFLPHGAMPRGAYGRMAEQSMGKDTTTGHWELAGHIAPHPMPTYPEGFPKDVLDAFTEATGYGVRGNKPYSGTEVIRDYGREHLETGKLIVYTSADSVFQIAAHESMVPPEELYDICRKARAILQGEHGVGRVIARPFEGEWPFTRTANRRDFSLEPPQGNLLDCLKAAGRDVIAVGKITDIFASRGITDSRLTHGNSEGMKVTARCLQEDFHGLCFVNLVDFDMQYGHRNDAVGYAAALNAFDRWLGDAMTLLGEDDCLIITADHGCDPGDVSTDHTREYVPLLVHGPKVAPQALGTRATFCDVAATVAALLDVPWHGPGTAFLQ